MNSLRLAKTEEFDKIFSILEDSFPKDEYRTYEEQKALLKHPNYTVYVIPDNEAERIKAFISVWKFEDFAFIEHFAVNSVYRNQGLGSLILHEIMNLLPCQICLEVELPETDFAKRRIGFYQRNGFYINHYPYTQPPYAKEKQPIPLLIMTSGNSISKNRFDKIQETIFKEVYHASKQME